LVFFLADYGNRTKQQDFASFSYYLTTGSQITKCQKTSEYHRPCATECSSYACRTRQMQRRRWNFRCRTTF